ncbi:AraC family transcriptional regulator [Jidongwangia harbinensis]|uniref:AraC family transcriptional regulator n=1 Tax=Jidongwangia harbinensis TaxID=2878561 RepID=UPI001CDA2E6D|nr:AraC family transcriptional regulator [Jidongwangia harbinensis]MCA2213928.1 AraC family transcriptional regulator [Jidongwangia harbinensis]
MVLLAAARPATRSGDLVADLVADIVAATRRSTAVYSRSRFRAPWGVSVPRAHLASFHVVTAGTCWLVPEGDDPIHLTRGDVVLVPSGLAHVLVDSPGSPVRPFSDLVGGPLGDVPPTEVVIDGPGPVTGLLCGGYPLDAGSRHPLTALLPPVVHVSAAGAGHTGLGAAVDLLSREVDRAGPGATAVVSPLVELLFVYVLRAWLAERSSSAGGWVRALHDPVVGGALALIHGEPGRPWSVPALARAVGVSRATFSRRFTMLTGQAPMAYVTAWRMTVAARLLRQERTPLREIARRVGYDSEFAFARAFKRTVGHAPGRYRAAVGDPP